MIKFKFKLSILFLMLVLSLSMLCSFSTIKTHAAEKGSYSFDFENEVIGLTSGTGWIFSKFQKDETGVAENPTNSKQRSIQIRSRMSGSKEVWFQSSTAFTNMNLDVNEISVDLYIPESKFFTDEDSLTFLLRQSSASHISFVLSGNSIKSNGGTVYKENITRGEWFTLIINYDINSQTYNLSYQKGSEKEVLASNVNIGSSWNNDGVSGFTVRANFDTEDSEKYCYLDNVNVQAKSATPFLTDFKIEGVENEKLGEEITVSYNYFSDLEYKEESAQIQWYRAEEKYSGVGEKIDGATSKTYTTSSQDLGKYLFAQIKVIDDKGNESELYTSDKHLIYDAYKVYDFEKQSVGEVANDEYVFNKTGEILANVEQENGGKVLSLSGVSSSEDAASVAFESKYLYGFKDYSTIFSLDLYLTEELSKGDKLYLDLVSKKETQEMLYKAAYVYEDVLFVDDYNQFELPVEKWLTVKLITLEGAKYFIEVASNGSAIYVSPIKEVSELFLKNFYSEIGFSSFRVVYEGKKSSTLSTVKIDNLICRKFNGVSFSSFDFGNIVQNTQFEYTFDYKKLGKINNVIFQPTAGKLPNGIKVEGDKLVGTLKSAGEYNFTITAIDSNNNKTTANFKLIVDKLFKVSFVTNGGDPINALSVGDNSLIEQEIVPVRQGYLFVGWYKDQSFTQKWDYEVDVVNADIQLYAKWAKKEYMVSFYDENGEILKIESYDYRESVTYPEIEEAQDKKFVGWFTDKEKTMLFIEGSAMPANNLKLYGKWISDGNENDKKGCSSNINTTSIIVGACLILSSMLIIKKRERKDNN